MLKSRPHNIYMHAHVLPVALLCRACLCVQLWDNAINLVRTLYLLLLFGPVLLTAPIALSLGMKRSEWMELLRKTLETAGERACRIVHSRNTVLLASTVLMCCNVLAGMGKPLACGSVAWCSMRRPVRV